MNPAALVSSFNVGKPNQTGGNMIAFLKQLMTDESGQDLAEYGIALLVIAGGAAAAAILIAGDVQTLWTSAQGVIATAAGAA